MESQLAKPDEHILPLVSQLKDPKDREYFNSFEEKPKRTLAKIDIKFGDLTVQNLEQYRVLNYLALPVIYSNDFYNRFFTANPRWCKLGYFKDVLIGAISVKFD